MTPAYQASQTPPSTSWSCPECGSSVFNAQGLRGCLNCDWLDGRN